LNDICLLIHPWILGWKAFPSGYVMFLIYRWV
jgi:hypothetical protein